MSGVIPQTCLVSPANLQTSAMLCLMTWLRCPLDLFSAPPSGSTQPDEGPRLHFHHLPRLLGMEIGRRRGAGLVWILASTASKKKPGENPEGMAAAVWPYSALLPGSLHLCAALVASARPSSPPRRPTAASPT
jgi:hypothetical protein